MRASSRQIFYRKGESVSEPTVIRSRQFSHSGFSLVELALVVMVLAVVVGFAALSIKNTLPEMRVDKAAKQAAAALTEARYMAMSKNRDVQITFPVESGNHSRIDVRIATGSGWAFPTGSGYQGYNDPSVEFLYGSRFIYTSGMPDTPDNLIGAAPRSAVNFVESTTVTSGVVTPNIVWSGMFMPDGSLVNVGTEDIMNGTLFVAQSDNPKVARAVTILGSTGRVRIYRWSNNAWVK